MSKCKCPENVASWLGPWVLLVMTGPARMQAFLYLIRRVGLVLSQRVGRVSLEGPGVPEWIDR